MGEHYYEVLGRSQGTGQDEIKKAYFRLVRQCSPEKDPERFREIREAYENLKEAGNKKAVLTMEAPDEPFAKTYPAGSVLMHS